MPRPRTPLWLKRPLLPLWNTLAHGTRRASEYLGAVRRGRFGVCDVCGRFTPWLYRRGVIPRELEARWGLTPRQAEALARKESSDCAFCGAKLRARRLARVVMDTLPGTGDRPHRSFRRWVEDVSIKPLRVAEINRIDGIHDQLRRLPGALLSDFLPGVTPGRVVYGVRSEDLTRLTYASESFDLVLTSETLEHVPDLDAALAEIRRILVPGGYHIFTVPLLADVAKTFPRATLRPDGTVEQHAPMVCHPGGDVGYPVFTEFGLDLPEILSVRGFTVETRYWPPSDDDVCQVFLCRRDGPYNRAGNNTPFSSGASPLS